MIVHSSVEFPDGKSLRLSRTYAAPIHRVFRAWVDIGDLERWFTPDAAWPARVEDLTVRQGGGFTASFGAPGETPWIEHVQYVEIDPPTRLVFLGHMTHDGAFVTVTRYTVTLTEVRDGTELILHEFGSGPDDLKDRGGGWGGTLDNLATVLG